MDTNPQSPSQFSSEAGKPSDVSLEKKNVKKTAKNNKKTNDVFLKLTRFISLLIEVVHFHMNRWLLSN